MSTRSVDTAGRVLAGGAAALLALVLAACGASTPRQAAVEAPAPVTPAAEPSRRERRAAEAAAKPQAAAVAEPQAAEPPRDQRRGGRRKDSADAEAAAALDVIPEPAALAYERALTALRTENWLQAELELEQLAAEYPAYAGPHVNLAIVYLHDGRRADGRAALDRALAIEPGHPAANNELAILLREEGRFDEAERAYRRALETDPSYALAHYNLGVLLDMYLRRPAEALEQYELYQSALSEPDQMVGRWIVDLRRRTGSNDNASRVAQGDTP